MLKAGKSDANIAAMLAPDTITDKRPARGIRVVSDFVAEVRKGMTQK